jgi:hypothetical protein
MTCSFQVGQKVVCLQNWHLNGRGYGDEIGPKKGEIYTIRDIGFLSPVNPEMVVVRLHEIRNPERPYRLCGTFEPCFDASQFRPVVQRKTSIEIFKSLLNPVRERADA